MMENIRCIYCGCEEIKLNGRFSNSEEKEIIRYRCKDSKCGKSFSSVTNTLLYRKKKGRKKLKDYSKLMHKKLSLRNIAKILEISLPTAFKWRHIILGLLDETNKKHKLEGTVKLINTLHKENFKGQRNIEKPIRETVNLVVPFDSKQRSNPTITSVGRVNLEKLCIRIEKIVKSDALVITVRNSFLLEYKKKHNKEVGMVKETTFFDENWIVPISKGWFKKFRGVGTKYLEEYFAWFVLHYKMYGKECKRRNMIEKYDRYQIESIIAGAKKNQLNDVVERLNELYV